MPELSPRWNQCNDGRRPPGSANLIAEVQEFVRCLLLECKVPTCQGGWL